LSARDSRRRTPVWVPTVAALAALAVLAAAYLYLPALGEKPFTIEKAGEDDEGARWIITDPVGLPASRSEVEATVWGLSRLRPADTYVLAEPAEAAEYGLDRPAAEVRIELEGGAAPPSLVVGDATPVGDHRYVMIGDDDSSVHLVPAGDIEPLLQGPFGVMEKRVVPWSPGGSTTIRFRSRDLDVAMVKGDEGWTSGGEEIEYSLKTDVIEALRAFKASGLGFRPDDAALAELAPGSPDGEPPEEADFTLVVERPDDESGVQRRFLVAGRAGLLERLGGSPGPDGEEAAVVIAPEEGLAYPVDAMRLDRLEKAFAAIAGK